MREVMMSNKIKIQEEEWIVVISQSVDEREKAG
jgi:hypothetical protein